MNTNLFQITFQVTATSSSVIPVVTTVPVATTTTLLGTTVPGATAPPTTLGATVPAPVTSSTLIQLNPTGSSAVVSTTQAGAPTTVATVASQSTLPSTETTATVSPVAEAGVGEIAFTGASIEIAVIGLAFVLAGAVLSVVSRRDHKRA
jgi:hypothetical protein